VNRHVADPESGKRGGARVLHNQITVNDVFQITKFHIQFQRFFLVSAAWICAWFKWAYKCHSTTFFQLNQCKHVPQAADVSVPRLCLRDQHRFGFPLVIADATTFLFLFVEKTQRPQHRVFQNQFKHANIATQWLSLRGQWQNLN
jgi:hypothetical protein